MGSRDMSAAEDVRDRQERAAKNQSLFREVNERVKDVNESFHTATFALSDWVCECANDTCVERIEMSSQEYDAIREQPARFLVATSDDHVWPDVERVVERHENYWIVEKFELAATIAEREDPRANGSSPRER